MEKPSHNTDAALISPYEKTLSAPQAALERRLLRAVGSSLERASWERCRRVGAYLGLVFFNAGRRKRKLAIANVQLALACAPAQAIRIVRRSAQNWGMTSCEFLHLPGATERELRDYASLDGLEHLQAALQGGKGAILMTAHLGNWEVLVARLALEYPITAIVRPLSNAALTEHMTSIRRGVGIEVTSKHAGARPTLKALGSGGIICLLPDRHAGPDGAYLPLFGHPTRFETAPARLAVMTEAPLVPILGVRREPWLTDGRIDGRIWPPFVVRATSRAERAAATLEGTRQVIASLEDMVRAAPDQWSWMLRRWRADDADPKPSRRPVRRKG